MVGLSEYIPSATTVGLALATIFLVHYVRKRKRTKVAVVSNSERNENSDQSKDKIFVTHFDNMPGPIGLPVLGSSLSFGKYPHLDLLKWSKQYGPVFRMKLGSKNVVVVTGYQHIKEALLKQGTAFSGRVDMMTTKYICGGLSLSFSTYSPNWKVQKTKAQKALNLYTCGRDNKKRVIMEETAFEQANNLVKHLLKTTEPQRASETARQASANVICMICFGLKFDFGDPVLQETLDSSDAFDEIMGTMNVVNFCPWMTKIPKFRKSFERFIAYMDYYNNFIAELLNRTWGSYDENNLRHATDCLRYESAHGAGTTENEDGTLTLMQKEKQNGAQRLADKLKTAKIYQAGEDVQEEERKNEETDHVEFKMAASGDHERVMRCIQDIYGAGFETMATAFEWIILYLAVFEDIQEKIADEVRRVIPLDETPSMRTHGEKCLKVSSFMCEFLRHCCMFPLPIPHCTIRDTHLGGYHIPKGNAVFFNFYEAHRNADNWGEDPDSFIPERFIKTDEEGVKTLDKKKQNALITFGLGLRKCLGEKVAKNELFIFLCVLTRHCKIQPYIKGKHPTLPWPLYPKLTIAPQEFKVIVNARKNGD